MWTAQARKHWGPTELCRDGSPGASDRAPRAAPKSSCPRLGRHTRRDQAQERPTIHVAAELHAPRLDSAPGTTRTYCPRSAPGAARRRCRQRCRTRCGPGRGRTINRRLPQNAQAKRLPDSRIGAVGWQGDDGEHRRRRAGVSGAQIGSRGPEAHGAGTKRTVYVLGGRGRLAVVNEDNGITSVIGCGGNGYAGAHRMAWKGRHGSARPLKSTRL
jgi:hypothetical protein